MSGSDEVLDLRVPPGEPGERRLVVGRVVLLGPINGLEMVDRRPLPGPLAAHDALRAERDELRSEVAILRRREAELVARVACLEAQRNATPADPETWEAPTW